LSLKIRQNKLECWCTKRILVISFILGKSQSGLLTTPGHWTYCQILEPSTKSLSRSRADQSGISVSTSFLSIIRLAPKTLQRQKFEIMFSEASLRKKSFCNSEAWSWLRKPSKCWTNAFLIYNHSIHFHSIAAQFLN
jgi:hypothetical protein